MWNKWSEVKPAVGVRFVVAADDGCSVVTGMAADGDMFVDAERGWKLSDRFLDGAIWAPLPDDYVLLIDR